MSTLRLVFVAQLLVMLTGFVVFLVTPADFHTIVLLFYLVVAGAVTALYAAWQFVKHPARRRLAGAVIATPLVCLTTPFLIVGLNGNPISPQILGVAAAALGAAVAYALLSRKQHWQENGTCTNKRFNILIAIALAALLVLYWAPIIFWLYNQDSIKLPNDISSRSDVLQFGAIYFVSVAGPALLLSLFALLYAPVGLVRNKGGRLVHLGQLFLALTTLISLAGGAIAVFIFIVNPG